MGEAGESKKWMQQQDAGMYYVTHRARMKYVASAACLLGNCACHEITGPIDSTLTVNQIYQGLCEDVMLTLLYLLSDEEMFKTEQLKLGIEMPFRVMHGRRLQADRASGATASQIAFEFRVSYACGLWEKDIKNALSAASGPVSSSVLRKWHVIENVEGEAAITHRHQTREMIVRAMCACRMVTTAVWAGSIFGLARLFSPDPAERDRAFEQHKLLFKQLLLYEERLASPDASSELKDFDCSFIWRHSVTFREVLQFLVMHPELAHIAVLAFLRLSYESYYHTVGIENTFKWTRAFCPYQ